jgi:multiple sugar transport system substrate-binding protein
MAPIPAIFDEQLMWANSHQFFITKQATADENKYAAAQVFIAWLSEHSGDWAGAGMIPARQSVRDEGALEGTKQATVAELIDNMRFLPPVPGIGTVQTEALEPAVAAGVQGKSSPSEALGTAAQRGNELMERNLESFGG